MKIWTRSLLAGVACIALLGCQRPESPPVPTFDDDRAAVQRAAELWITAYNARSAGAFASVFADDAWLMKPGQPPITGRRAIQDDVMREWATRPNWAPAPLVVTTGETDLEISGDLAWRSGRFEGRDDAGQILTRGTFIEIWHRVDGDWKMFRSIFNTDHSMAASGPVQAAQ